MEETNNDQDNQEKVKIIQEAPSKEFTITPARKEQFSKCRAGLEAYQKARREIKQEEQLKKAQEKINLYKQTRMKMEQMQDNTKEEIPKVVQENPIKEQAMPAPGVSSLSSSSSSSELEEEKKEKAIIDKVMKHMANGNEQMVLEYINNLSKNVSTLIQEWKEFQKTPPKIHIPEEKTTHVKEPNSPVNKKRKNRKNMSESEEEEEEIDTSFLPVAKRKQKPIINYVRRAR